MLASFWLRFGTLFGPFLAPKSGQSFVQDALSSFIFFKNVIFTKTIKKMNVDDCSAQDGSENDPKLAEDHSKTVPKAIIVHDHVLLQLWRVLDSVLVPFRDPFGLQDRPQKTLSLIHI